MIRKLHAVLVIHTDVLLQGVLNHLSIRQFTLSLLPIGIWHFAAGIAHQTVYQS